MVDRNFFLTLARCRKQGKSAGHAYMEWKLGHSYKGGGSIPADYTQVEYIESNGKQYIDTGYLIAENSKCEIVQAFTKGVTSGYQDFGGIDSNGNTAVNRFFMRSDKNGFLWAIGMSGGYLKSFDLEKHTFKADYAQRTGWVDEASGKINSPFETTTVKRTVALFALNYTSVINYSNVKLYSAKFWYGDNLVRDFVPVVRKSDNVGGLWDKVEKKFYTNKTETPFIVP